MLTKDIAKDVAKYIGKAACTLAATKATTGIGIDTGMAKAIIGFTLLGIGQHLVGLFGLFEFFFRFLIARIAIGVELHRELAIRFFQLFFTRVLCNPEHIVKISFSHECSSIDS